MQLWLMALLVSDRHNNECYGNKIAKIDVKNFQFKTHCNGDSHRSKTKYHIVTGVVIKHR